LLVFSIITAVIVITSAFDELFLFIFHLLFSDFLRRTTAQTKFVGLAENVVLRRAFSKAEASRL
jgi:hypothetical protein